MEVAQSVSSARVTASRKCNQMAVPTVQPNGSTRLAASCCCQRRVLHCILLRLQTNTEFCSAVLLRCLPTPENCNRRANLGQDCRCQLGRSRCSLLLLASCHYTGNTGTTAKAHQDCRPIGRLPITECRHICRMVWFSPCMTSFIQLCMAQSPCNFWNVGSVLCHR